MLGFFAVLFLVNIVRANVHQLTVSSFNRISNEPMALVKYYAPWCGHCKNLAPKFVKAAETLLDGPNPAFLAEVDCTVEKDLCSEIQGYPTLKLYKYGQFAENYEGEHSHDALVSFIRKKSGPASMEFYTKEEHAKLLNTDLPCISAQFVKDSLDETAWKKVADTFRGVVKMVHTYSKLVDSSKDTAVELHLSPKLKCPLEEQIHRYTGAMKVDDLTKWIKSNAFGLVGIRNKDNSFMFEMPMLVLYAPIDDKKFPSNAKYYRNRLVKVSKSSDFKLSIVISDGEDFRHEIDQIGADYSGNALAVILAEEGKTFVMEEKFGVPELTEFLKNYAAGSLKPFIKSEPIPDAKDGHVTKVVGKNFEEIVFDQTKDVLLEVYAPWCGHCKQLKPKYDELAEKLSGDSANVVIANIDGTANTLPKEFKFTGFPTIFWVPKDNKHNPLLYNGERETDKMLAWVAEKATTELEHYSRSGVRKTVEL